MDRIVASNAIFHDAFDTTSMLDASTMLANSGARTATGFSLGWLASYPKCHELRLKRLAGFSEMQAAPTTIRTALAISILHRRIRKGLACLVTTDPPFAAIAFAK
jgi:hypothetical protein